MDAYPGGFTAKSSQSWDGFPVFLVKATVVLIIVIITQKKHGWRAPLESVLWVSKQLSWGLHWIYIYEYTYKYKYANKYRYVSFVCVYMYAMVNSWIASRLKLPGSEVGGWCPTDWAMEFSHDLWPRSWSTSVHLRQCALATLPGYLYLDGFDCGLDGRLTCWLGLPCWLFPVPVPW